MKAYKKHYLGNGQEVVTGNGKVLDIVKVVLSVEEIMNYVHTYKGEEYVSFEVARMKSPNDYGDTHTVYHTTFEDVEEEAPVTAPQKRRVGRPTNAEIAQRKAAAELVKARQEMTDPQANKECAAEKAELAQTPQTEDAPF